jgi:RNA polymerase sigma-70 factor (ECF subfamily)
MRASSEDIKQWLEAARAGCREALGKTLEASRLYLLWLARRELDPGLRAKAGESDLVQETFMEVCRDFDRFTGKSEKELLAWLRRMLRNNLMNFARTYRATAKRDIASEVSLETMRATDSAEIAVATGDPAPSQQAIEREEAVLLLEALARLPADCQEIIALWNQEHSFEEIARLTGRPASTVRAKWLQAIGQLQQLV